MRTSVLLALTVFIAGCSTPSTNTRPYAKANSLMQREISARIANFKYQHGQELLNNMMWLESKAGETAIVDLLAALKDEDAKVRSSSIWVLGRIRDRRTIPALQDMIKDGNEVVRLEAARSLVMMGDMVHVPTLIEGLDSEKTPVRYNCHMALRDATRKDFEYDHLEEDAVQRQVSVLRWREWWSKQSADPWFAASYARKHGLASEMVKESQPAMPVGETSNGQTPTGDHPATERSNESVPDTTGQKTGQPATPTTTPSGTNPSGTDPSGTNPSGTDPSGTTPKSATPPVKTGEKGTEEDAGSGAVFKLLDLGGEGDAPKGKKPTGSATPKTPSGSSDKPAGTPTEKSPTKTPETGTKTGTESEKKAEFKPAPVPK